MAQPEVAAGEVGNPADSNPADAFTAIAEEMLGDEPEQDEQPEGDEPEGELDEPELEEEADDLPPIDAPVSWDAEAKAKFAELPRELQETVTKREAERERFVQSKSQEAAKARQEVERAAYEQLAAYDQSVAQQYQQIAEQLQPQRPDPRMLQVDPQAFYAQQAEYEATVAQRQEMQQRAQFHATQAQQRAQAAEQAQLAEQHQVIAEQFPEYADPTTGPEWQRKLTAVAKEVMGYPDELISQARAADILATKRVYDLKVKADKYDALQAKRMEKVRAAKGLPRVATPGVAQGTDQVRANRAQAAWEATKNSKGRARDDAFAAYLKTQGVL